MFSRGKSNGFESLKVVQLEFTSLLDPLFRLHLV